MLMGRSLLSGYPLGAFLSNDRFCFRTPHLSSEIVWDISLKPESFRQQNFTPLKICSKWLSGKKMTLYYSFAKETSNILIETWKVWNTCITNTWNWYNRLKTSTPIPLPYSFDKPFCIYHLKNCDTAKPTYNQTHSQKNTPENRDTQSESDTQTHRVTDTHSNTARETHTQSHKHTGTQTQTHAVFLPREHCGRWGGIILQ